MNTLRTLFLMSGLLICLTSAQADDVLTVESVTLPQNGEVALEIKGTFETDFTMFELEIELDAGITLKLNNNERPWSELGGTGTDHTITSSTPSANTFKFVCSSMSQLTLPENEVLMRVMVEPSEELEVGTVLNGTIKNILFNEHTSSGNIGHNFAAIPFTVTIGEPTDGRILLDETSTDVPEAATNVNVRVKRTINANEWSTICLPFAMTEAQVKAVFGDDVQLAEFMEYEVSDDSKQISVIFDNALLDVDGFMANNPYIIKVSSKIEEFTVDGVTVTPDEEKAVAEYDNGKTGSRREVYGTFKGTYHAGTIVPNNCLFLNSNRFWYSAGNTNMKAFRGYFNFKDVLEDADGARIGMSFDDETTGIGYNKRETITNNIWYTLDGRKLDKKPAEKGIYIRNNKKVVIQ